jgi:cytosine/adenosine deaminase-related metal-dependent hydrolase
VDPEMNVRSKYFIDWTGRIFENAFLEITAGRVATVNTESAHPELSKDCVDLGDCCILMPGLVNAHTHLELTLARDLVRPQPKFTDWIRNVIQVTNGWDANKFARSFHEGIRQSIEAGTTAIGDIVRHTESAAHTGDSLRFRPFFEVIDFNPATAAATILDLKDRLNRYSPVEGVSAGISPHTPYTVSEQLLRKCMEIAEDDERPLCIHLAETQAEREFLMDGSGEILEFRKEFGLPKEWKAPGKSPVRYLRDIGALERPALLVHCNYVDETDMDIIAASGSSVVFCPRSHRYFLHRRYPLEKMIDKGINVALGTDSLASSPSLSILDEMKAVKAAFPSLRSADIVKLATTNGSRALLFPHDFERFQPGVPADLTGIVVSAQELQQARNPLDALFSASARAIFSMVEGKILLDAASFGARRA